MTRFTSLLLAFLVSATAFGETTDAKTDDVAAFVTAMAKVGFAGAPSFSPDGKEIAFLTNISGSPQVWRVPVRGGYPQMVTALDDPVSYPFWSPDGQWIAFSSAPGGGMNTQVFIIRPDGTALRRLTEGGKINNWIGPWSHDGSSIGLASSRRSPDALDAYLLSTSGEFRLIAKNEGVATVDSLSRDGQRVIVNRLRSRGSNDLFLVDAKSAKEILLTPHEGPGTFEGDLSPDGTAVYLTSNKDRDLGAFGRIVIRDGKAGAIEILAERADAELENVELDGSGSRAALLWNRAGKSELAIYDLTTKKESVVQKLPAEIVRELTFSPDGSQLAFSASGAAHPSDVYVMDVASQEIRRLTWSPHSGVDLGKLVRPELVRYKALDGLELSGWLYRASSAGKGPVVLSFHGGPEGQEQPSFNSTYQALVARGITVFAPNVRGSAGFGKRFVNLDNGALRVNGVRDIKATIDHLVRSEIAHPKKIGIMGGSYGGYMVMAGLTEYPTEIAAGANLFGVVNFETFFANSEPWMAAISTIEYGDPKTEAEMLRALSPLTKIDRVVSPTIVLHGANDTNVPVIEAEQVVENLKKRNVPVEYVLFPDEGHGWTKTANRIKSTVSIVNWFTKYLTQ
jgi:dipeptidyl aminopeptidase/acylaminoacyl peptidase